MINPECCILGCSREAVNRIGLCRRHLRAKRREVLDRLVAEAVVSEESNE